MNLGTIPNYSFSGVSDESKMKASEQRAPVPCFFSLGYCPKG
jgi:hypothetical protein